MVIAIHQPGYLPWAGFFHKLASADLMVLADHVQFERHGFQNRNQIKQPSKTTWLTVPVRRGHLDDPLAAKEIADDGTAPIAAWKQKNFAALENAYRKAPYYEPYIDELRRIHLAPWQRLVNLNVALIERIASWLGIGTRMVRSSSVGARGGKTDAVIDLCRRFGADTYLSGRGASQHYLDVERLAAAGIGVRWQEFIHPKYPQLHPAQGFVPRLSVVDLLCNCGPRSRDLLLGDAPAVLATA